MFMLLCLKYAFVRLAMLSCSTTQYPSNSIFNKKFLIAFLVSIVRLVHHESFI